MLLGTYAGTAASSEGTFQIWQLVHSTFHMGMAYKSPQTCVPQLYASEGNIPRPLNPIACRLSIFDEDIFKVYI
jgi:hypothetical protein